MSYSCIGHRWIRLRQIVAPCSAFTLSLCEIPATFCFLLHPLLFENLNFGNCRDRKLFLHFVTFSSSSSLPQFAAHSCVWMSNDADPGGDEAIPRSSAFIPSSLLLFLVHAMDVLPLLFACQNLLIFEKGDHSFLLYLPHVNLYTLLFPLNLAFPRIVILKTMAVMTVRLFPRSSAFLYKADIIYFLPIRHPLASIY